LRVLCEAVKHWVLAKAHPLPDRIELETGKPGTIQHAVVLAVAHELLPEMQCIHVTTPDDTESMDVRPIVWIDDSDIGVYGWEPVCRYLGRLWRSYPIHPENALSVDGSLAHLNAFMRSVLVAEEEDEDVEVVTHIVVSYLKEMETRQSEFDDDKWLEGFDEYTIADLCWYTALRFTMDKHDLEADDVLPSHTLMAMWFERMQQKYVSDSYGEKKDI